MSKEYFRDGFVTGIVIGILVGAAIFTIVLIGGM